MSPDTHIATFIHEMSGKRDSMPLRIGHDPYLGFYAMEPRLGCGKNRQSEFQAAKQLLDDHAMCLVKLDAIAKATGSEA
jgi:hypothetical protein